MTCLNCNKEFIGRKKKYCSKKCSKQNFHRRHPEKQLEYQHSKKIGIETYKLARGCDKCGYIKCAAALDFHHINPSKKKFGINQVNWSNSNRVKLELKKCILLCKNCHSELHYKESNENPKKL
jgi:hypothetical protein